MRPSILYASETYYNLTEVEIRQIERIEESYLRQLTGAPRWCPITQLYLETGQYCARFEVIRLRLLFLKYILRQDENSTIYKFLKLQLKHSIHGNWASLCNKDIKLLKLNMSFSEIKNMKLSKFKLLLKERIRIESLNYLLKKRKVKGQEIEYKSLQISDYFLPNKIIQSIEDKKFLFSLRNQTIQLSEFGSKQECVCEMKQNVTLTHIYSCKMLNTTPIQINYERIFNGKLEQQKAILDRMKINIRRYEILIVKSKNKIIL